MKVKYTTLRTDHCIKNYSIKEYLPVLTPPLFLISICGAGRGKFFRMSGNSNG